MSHLHIEKIAGELTLAEKQVAATARLLEEDATVPFIARYRKEVTGSLDEVAITAIRDRLAQLAALDERRGAILKSLEERELLTGELKGKITAAQTMAVLEDIYLPFRPKRRTRATIAREKGLEPLADSIFEQGAIDPAAEAIKFIDPGKGVETAAEALQGARDILAERVSEDQSARAAMRALFAEKANIRSMVITGRETEGEKYRDYFAWIRTGPIWRPRTACLPSAAAKRRSFSPCGSSLMRPRPSPCWSVSLSRGLTPRQSRCGLACRIPTSACCQLPWRLKSA